MIHAPVSERYGEARTHRTEQGLDNILLPSSEG
jgi:hypothetical protein